MLAATLRLRLCYALLARGYRLAAIRRALARHAAALRTLYPHVFN